MNQVFKALSSSVRREILEYLSAGEMTAGEISSKFKLSDSTISNHLNCLKKADLCSCRRNGNELIYGLKLSVIEDVMLTYISKVSKKTEKGDL